MTMLTVDAWKERLKVGCLLRSSLDVVVREDEKVVVVVVVVALVNMVEKRAVKRGDGGVGGAVA